MVGAHEQKGAPGGAGLAARLQDARRRAFVGRHPERDLFRSALTVDPPPFAVLHIHGPGGIGKTALLHQFVQMARDGGWEPMMLDGRRVDPSPTGLRSALASSLGVEPDDAIATLGDRRRPVLLFDTYEMLAPIDRWIRDTLIPQLPRQAMVVLAGRNPPAPGWREDPGWAELLQVVALRDLGGDEARSLLHARGVEPSRHDDVLRVTRGHPLALALVGDVLADQDEDVPFALEDSPHVIDGLLQRLLRRVPSEAHHRALHAAAQAGIATEALVRDTVPEGAAGPLFDWLRRLSFTEPVTGGVAVHDLVSDALNAELRWRDPDGWYDLHERVTHHLERRLARASGAGRHRAMLDILQLSRLHRGLRDFYDWERSEQLWLDPAGRQDHEVIESLTRQHEGEESARIVRYWLAHQPEAFTVFRGHDGSPAGFVSHLLLGDAPGEEVHADPIVAAVWDHVRAYGPLRRGERLRVLRHWVARDTYQGVATHHLTSVRSALDWIDTERLGWGFVVLSDPAFFDPVFAFLDFSRPTELEVAVGPRRYGFFARDFRATSKRTWRELLRDRRASRSEAGGARPVEQPDRLLVLAEEDFADAVRDALRGVARPGGLAGNPLLRSRVVREHADGRSGEEALASLLQQAVDELAHHPRDERKQRALELTYLRPAPTQEAAAERLDLPFSTFRRHLTAGVDHVVSRLWDLELHGAWTGGSSR